MIKTRLIKLLDHAKKYIVYNVIWQFVALIAQVIAVFRIAQLLEHVFYGSITTTELGITAGILAGVIGVRVLSDKMIMHSAYMASADVKRILRKKIYEKLLKLGASYKEKVATSEVVQVSTEGVDQLETYFGRYLPQFFYSMMAPILLFVILQNISMKASVVLLICVPLIPISIVVVQKIAKRLLNKYWGIYTGLGDSFLENLQGLTTMKIYQADEKKAQEMDEEAQQFRTITMKVLTMQLNSTSVMDIIAYGGAAVGIIVAISEYMKENISLAGVITITLLASEFFIPLRLLGSFFHIAMNGMAASDKIFKLLDMEEGEKGTETLDEKHLDIRFENVRFSYEADREILKGIDLNLEAGSFVSIVGESGCGKSTIAGLISGKNKLYDGSIRIGGKELREVREEEMMKAVTLIRHNSYLFKGTVEENLRMGKPEATVSEMEEALAKVNLLDFINAQQGLKTQLQEKAGNLSGGQCQRLALARALLHDSPIYIFDEATSNIDAESEEDIMKVIHELAKMKTVILISHRLSNVVDSDRIYMLAEGEIKESGTHEELMKQNGPYKHLFDTQKRLEGWWKYED